MDGKIESTLQGFYRKEKGEEEEGGEVRIKGLCKMGHILTE